MAAPILFRSDFDADRLRRGVRRSRDAAQARRLLALAAIYDGGSRGDAARIAGAEFGREDTLDTGFEGVSVDRPAEYEGRDHAAHGHPCDDGRRLPAAVGEAHPQPLAARCSPQGARPWVRAMSVFARVSSMKTRLSGSRSIWPSNPC